MTRRQNLIGERSGKLVVIEYHSTNKRKESCWLCLCDCGNSIVVSSKHLRVGDTASCGCLHRKGEEASYHRVFSKYVLNAKNRGRVFELEEEFFIDFIKKPCFYCGVEGGSCFSEGKFVTIYYSSIDRIDNDKGYSKDNILPACRMCNTMKQKFSKESFINQALRIARQHGSNAASMGS